MLLIFVRPNFVYLSYFLYKCCGKLTRFFMMYGIKWKWNLMRFTNLLLISQIISDKYHVFDDMTFSQHFSRWFVTLIFRSWHFIPFRIKIFNEKVNGKAKTLLHAPNFRSYSNDFMQSLISWLFHSLHERKLYGMKWIYS